MYKRLAKLGVSVGVEEKDVYELLKVADKPGERGYLNIENEVKDALKQFVMVRGFVQHILDI